jgi:mannitol-1-phosphate/altronate dehydrogenase
LILDHPDVVQDLAEPEAPASVPGAGDAAVQTRPAADADELRQHPGQRHDPEGRGPGTGYLIRASDRFGRAWTADDPYAERIAAIADRIGNDSKALADAILAIDTIFRPELAQSPVFREHIVRGLKGFLAPHPIEYLRSVCEMQTPQLNDAP